MTNLLTPEERKALINKLVAYDADYYSSVALADPRAKGKIRKGIRKLYNLMSDAQLMSFKFEGGDKKDESIK